MPETEISPGLNIRTAEKDDVPLILEFVRGIAAFENLSHLVTATEESLKESMFLHCIKLAKERNCGRMEWSVLDWNPAREFYEYFGAGPVEGWHIYRMDEDKFENALEK